jgi:antitoxin (DNA-binding transcriptional repressor) of toxin-antitoxin stability system
MKRIRGEVEQTGKPVTILKRGRPVALLAPSALGQNEYPQLALFGTVEILGNVVEPVLPAGDWEAESDPGL